MPVAKVKMSGKYLYGASIQGIQGFIFQTSKLRDIAGASELVDRVCGELFESMFPGGFAGSRVIAAAGKVQYVFDSFDDCATAVLNFPRKVMREAPGVTISQAVERFADDDFGDAVGRLEQKLRARRNMPAAPLLVGLMGVRRSQSTGLPLVYNKNEDGENVVCDASTYAKREACEVRALCEKSFGVPVRKGEVAYELGKMTGRNDWLAVIHADGNSLGRVVQAVGRLRKDFAAFSQGLDDATVKSANEAYASVLPAGGWPGGVIPIRPVVLGGDDMTVIIRADLAIQYVEEFIRRFEHNTKDGKVGEVLRRCEVFDTEEPCLTACAGVAFVKSSYPFHFGYRLAEELCAAAKAEARRLGGTPPRSCLMFHKVQDSFVRGYGDIRSRELEPLGRGPSLCHGPYFVNDGDLPRADDGRTYMTISELKRMADKLDSFPGVRTGIRRWLSLLRADSAKAGQHLDRLREVNPSAPARGLIDALTRGVSVPAYDCLALHTISSQDTKG